jgi:murein DD-endopeptidase MepM/ murein hydrolase activator NlpD
MFAILRWFISLVAILSSEPNETRAVDQDVKEKEIVLREDSTLVVTAWRGSAKCKEGDIYLQEPAAKAMNPYKLPGKKSDIIGSDVIFDHLPENRETVVLGPYTKDTKITFAFKFKGDCNASFPHNTERVYVEELTLGHYQLNIEDQHDRDFDDLHLQVIVKEIPREVSLSASATAEKAFNTPPNYSYPWSEGRSYPITKGPGTGDHVGRAFDFGMRRGDEVRASEKGLVLWVEDTFGPGGCNISLLGRVNVVVIQTEEGVNQNYLHLQQNSVQESNVRVGDIVEQGQLIGKAGNSGYSCSKSGGDGAHLHIEWTKNCYDLDGERERRKKYPVGKPTLAWNCPNFHKDTPFNFN